MLQEIIESLNFTPVKKQIYVKMAEEFEENLPGTLYMTQYDLEETLYGNAQEWREFLKIPEVNRFVEVEMAGLAEIGSRKALQRLQSTDASSPEIQAARQLIDNSKLLKQKVNQFQSFVVTRIPAKEANNDETTDNHTESSH